MQASATRANVIAKIRERMVAHVSERLTDRQAIQLAVSSAMRDSGDIIEWSLPAPLAKAALRKLPTIKISTDEWATLFGASTQPIRDGGLGKVVGSPEFIPQALALQNALKTTIGEREQKAAWERPWCRALIYVSMHMEFADDALVAVLGTVIRADGRRIEDLRAQIDDNGPETVLVTACIESLSASLV